MLMLMLMVLLVPLLVLVLVQEWLARCCAPPRQLQRLRRERWG